MTGKTDQPPAQRLRLNLRQLEVFVATARGGSTRAAAERIARSQSAASSALADLENAVGARLFDRIGRRLLLNENGRALLPKAQALIEQAGQVQALLRDEHAAPLRVAASFTIGEYLLPERVSQWIAMHPQSQVQLHIANTRDVIDAVAGLDVDAGFIEGPQTHPDLVVRAWRTDELVIVAAPGHPLAGRRATHRQLSQATWVLREHGSGTRQVTDAWLIENLEQVHVGLELGSTEAIKRVVASGTGLACLSRFAVEQALEDRHLIELRTRLPAGTRRLATVTHRNKLLCRTTADFLRHCGALAPQSD
ncbi:LysR family transcriptional regulator [Verminephrobacter eiseniae]|uniref:LysR family transcriptional regulator n=1 Tax=Verminephrobacter eiseniae TaxID=364317 RepID=UPI002237EF5E|nr:LysR family transcriptional regulator [Verminephrobacter eiseniae]MCW5237110.1 LysR family transcriptional regulator [Verminephrobacter eiseniae]